MKCAGDPVSAAGQIENTVLVDCPLQRGSVICAAIALCTKGPDVDPVMHGRKSRNVCGNRSLRFGDGLFMPHGNAALAAIGANLESDGHALFDVTLRWRTQRDQAGNIFPSLHHLRHVIAKNMFECDLMMSLARIAENNSGLADVLKHEVAAIE